ncbi:MAG: TolC family protein [Steroidobacteraceae bacterium]
MQHRLQHRMRCAALLAVAQLAAGCAVYRPLPLARAPQLARQLSDVTTRLPAGTSAPHIDLSRALTLGDIGWLALLNDPDLAAQRGQLDAARADLLQASLLPNPSASVSYAAFLGGPGATPAWSASLTEDIAALITYHERKQAARAAERQVNAQLLWDEWQVAEKARLTALDLYWDERSLGFATREHDVLGNEIDEVRTAVAAGNLDASALAPLEAARATADQSLASLRIATLGGWQALDALLDLDPQVRFPIAPPDLAPLPSDLSALIAGLPERRPDLIALQLGYRSADRSVRAAILGQFPALVLGGTWGQDTTNVRSAGPTATFDLPIFNRNQGQIAQSRATRLLLHEQYQARLDTAAGEVRSLAAQARRLATDIEEAQDAAASAEALARSARAAYAQGNLDRRSLADYETAVLERELAAASLQRSRGEVAITLTVSLARGLPDALVIPPGRAGIPRVRTQ